jgi:GGDEF domain-containing protein
VLREVASSIRALAGEHDIVARTGGDEFSVALPCVAIEAAARYAAATWSSIGDATNRDSDCRVRQAVTAPQGVRNPVNPTVMSAIDAR